MSAKGRLLELEQLSQAGLLELDPKQTVAFWTISPVEVHGPHLPLGTDLRIGEGVLRRAAALWLEGDERRRALLLPPLPLGADVLPLPGSLEVSREVLEQAILQCGAGLARLGLSALVLGNNHGGPRHLIALEAAARKLERRTGLLVVNPFGAFLRAMIRRDPLTLELTGLYPDTGIGGSRDVHAGNLETSVALALFEQDVSPGYRELPATSIPPRSRTAAAMRSTARLLRRRRSVLGHRADSGATGLDYAAGLLDWVSAKDVPSYVGPPAEATRERGQRCFEGMARFSADLLDRALAGEQVHRDTRPLLWELRALTRLPL